MSFPGFPIKNHGFSIARGSLEGKWWYHHGYSPVTGSHCQGQLGAIDAMQMATGTDQLMGER